MAGGIPELGFGVGTAFFKSSGQPDREALLKRCVHAALDAGFRHIDEAEMYENEATTGEALRAWLARNPGTPRSSLFVTSKVMTVEAGIENVCRRSLAAMKLEYFDLYLVHAPWKKSGAPFEMPLAQVWKQMEALVDAGLVRSIGVSNWRIADLQQIVDDARILPACNQIEAHPYLQQPALMRYCREHSIAVVAYSPLAPLTRPELRGGAIDAAVEAAAVAHGRSPAQILLRWSMQTGRLPITTSSRSDRLSEYMGSLDFELSNAEVATISDAGALKPQRFFWKQPPWILRIFSKIPMLQRMLPPAGQFSDDPSLEEDTSGKEIDR